MRANERTDERVAQYLRLYSCLFQTTVRGDASRRRIKRDISPLQKQRTHAFEELYQPRCESRGRKKKRRVVEGKKERWGRARKCETRPGKWGTVWELARDVWKMWTRKKEVWNGARKVKRRKKTSVKKRQEWKTVWSVKKCKETVNCQEGAEKRVNNCSKTIQLRGEKTKRRKNS